MHVQTTRELIRGTWLACRRLNGVDELNETPLLRRQMMQRHHWRIVSALRAREREHQAFAPVVGFVALCSCPACVIFRGSLSSTMPRSSILVSPSLYSRRNSSTSYPRSRMASC